MVLLGLFLHVVGNRAVLPLLAHAIRRPVVSDHRYEVDYTVEVLLAPDRKLDHDRTTVETVLDHAYAAVEVGAGTVHLVDEADTRNAVTVCLTPDGLGLRLDPGNGVEYCDGTVENSKGTLDLDREVNVTGGVDDVDPVTLPVTGRRRGRDRDAALLLLDHPVHDGSTLVNLTDLVGLTGVIEDALGRRRLPGVDVRHDPDVPRVIQRVLPDVGIASAALHLLERGGTWFLLLSCFCHVFSYHL